MHCRLSVSIFVSSSRNRSAYMTHFVTESMELNIFPFFLFFFLQNFIFDYRMQTTESSNRLSNR